MALRTARQGVTAARYDAAEARAKVTEALTDVSDEFSDLLAELWAADERAVSMEARADALDELVDVGVLSLPVSSTQVLPAESSHDEVDTLLEKIMQELRGGPVDAPQR